jgi:tol-pal system protein YbgF
VRRLAGLALLVSVAGCVTASKGREMEARIERLEGESELSAKQLEEQRAALRERIAAVDKKIEELNAAAHRTGADLAVNQDRLQEEVVRLRGILEEQAHRLDTLQRDTDARFAALKGAGALAEWEAKQKAAALQRPSAPGPFMALAQDQEAKGERGVARGLYEEFVKKWPTDPRAADAHFRLGELWFGDRRYREAILEYGKVAQDFPRSDKAPDALLRTGESMLALEDRGAAAKLFAEVVKRYPHTTAAKRARARLSEITRKRGAKKR